MSDDQDGPRGLKNIRKRLSINEPSCSRLPDTASGACICHENFKCFWLSNFEGWQKINSQWIISAFWFRLHQEHFTLTVKCMQRCVGERGCLEGLGVDGRILCNWLLKKSKECYRLVSWDSGRGQAAGWGLCTSGMLSSVDWYLVTEVLGQIIGPLKMGGIGCTET